MPLPKEQPPRKLSGPWTGGIRTLERGAGRARRRDNDLRRTDRGGIAARRARGLMLTGLLMIGTLHSLFAKYPRRRLPVAIADASGGDISGQMKEGAQ